MLDRTVDSVRAAAEIRRQCGDVQFVPVINEAIGNILVLPQAAVTLQGHSESPRNHLAAPFH